MKPAIDISAVMSNISLPKSNVEAVANCSRRQDAFINDFELPGYENISWLFLNARGIGNVQMTLVNRNNNKLLYREVPASTGFLAVCTKAVAGRYNLQFSISLS